MSDAEIIDHIKRKLYDKPIKILYKYFPVVKSFILSNSGNRSDAEDIFQEALIILFNKINSDHFELSSSLNTFLFGISKNLWHEQLRKNKKEISISIDGCNEPNTDEDLGFYIEENAKAKKAFLAFEQLGEKCKLLLNLFYYKKMSMVDIAKKLGFNSEAVAKNQKYRCIEKAKEIYLTIK